MSTPSAKVDSVDHQSHPKTKKKELRLGGAIEVNPRTVNASVSKDVDESHHYAMCWSRKVLEQYAVEQTSKLAHVRGKKALVVFAGSGSGDIIRMKSRYKTNPDDVKSLSRMHFMHPELDGTDVVRASKIPDDIRPWFMNKGKMVSGAHGEIEVSHCAHTLGQCTCNNIHPLKDEIRFFVFTHSFYYTGQIDWQQFREGDHIFVIAHEFEGTSGVFPRPESGLKPEFHWLRMLDGSIQMHPMEKFTCGTSYAHPDITPILEDLKFSWTERGLFGTKMHAYGVQDRTHQGGASCYHFVVDRREFPSALRQIPQVRLSPEPDHTALHEKASMLATRIAFSKNAADTLNAECGNVATLMQATGCEFDLVVESVSEAFKKALSAKQKLIDNITELTLETKALQGRVRLLDEMPKTAVALSVVKKAEQMVPGSSYLPIKPSTVLQGGATVYNMLAGGGEVKR